MDKIESLFYDYKNMEKEMKLLRSQLDQFVGISENEMLDTMVYGRSDEPRVQTSKNPYRSEIIALSYKEETEKANRELYQYLSKRYCRLVQELHFFEVAINQLPDDLAEFVTDLVIVSESWDNLMVKYHISRSTISRWKQKAIKELRLIYAIRNQQLEDFLLS